MRTPYGDGVDEEAGGRERVEHTAQGLSSRVGRGADNLLCRQVFLENVFRQGVARGGGAEETGKVRWGWAAQV